MGIFVKTYCLGYADFGFWRTLRGIMKGIIRRFMKPGPTWQFRIATFFGEIITIVVGIVLGLAVENYKEDLDRKDRAIELLVGLHKDLLRDLEELKTDSAALHQKAEAYRNFYLMGSGKLNDPTFLASNSWTLYSTTVLIPNTACYEVLKAHGELDIWKNNQLLTDIFTLYQEDVPNLLLAANSCNELVKNELSPYLRKRMVVDTSGGITNLNKCISTDYCRLLMMNLADCNDIAEARYGITIKAYQALIKGIEQEVGKAELSRLSR